jgi:hypothetical protein
MFAWRMMLVTRESSARFDAIDETGRMWTIDHLSYVSPQQAHRIVTVPDCARQFARFLKREITAETGSKVEIHATIWVSMNGRAPKLLIDPAVDLASGDLDRKSNWITPF